MKILFVSFGILPNRGAAAFVTESLCNNFTPEEMAVVLVEEGSYRGFGFVEREEMNGQPGYLKNAVKPFPGNPETTRIIQRYLSKQNGVKVVPLTGSAL